MLLYSYFLVPYLGPYRNYLQVTIMTVTVEVVVVVVVVIVGIPALIQKEQTTTYESRIV